MSSESGSVSPKSVGIGSDRRNSKSGGKGGRCRGLGTAGERGVACGRSRVQFQVGTDAKTFTVVVHLLTKSLSAGK